MIRLLRILTWALESLKILHFDWFLLCEAFKVWSKKVKRTDITWHWGMMKNLKKNELGVLKMSWGSWHILTQALESIEIFILKGSFCVKYILFELKKYRGVILHDTE